MAGFIAFATCGTSAPGAELQGSVGPGLTPAPADGAAAPRLTVFAERTGALGDDGATVPAVRHYTVQPGDTVEQVAARWRLQPVTVAWANPGVEQGLQPGQVLAIPAVDGVLHMVAAGETADSVAHDFGITRERLLDYNGLRSDTQVRPGTRLLVPGAKPPAHAPVAGGGAIAYRQSDYDHFPQGWCTWYVAQRVNVPWSGDAWSWFSSAQAAGWKTGSQPRAGAIMVTWESWYYGHVAYVESVGAGGAFRVSEMNYREFGAVDYRDVKVGSVPLIGFIYPPGT